MQKTIKLFLSFVLLFGLTACSKKHIELKEEYKKEDTAIDVELGDMPSLDVKDYLIENTTEEMLENTELTIHEIKDGNIVSDAIDTSAEGYFLPIGEYQLNLTNESDVLSLKIIVTDTTAPKFIKSTKELEYEEGTEKVDLTAEFEAEDLSELEITCEGEVDFNTSGKYTIRVIATDASENKAEVECVVTITKKTVATKPSEGGSKKPSSGGTNNGNSSNNSSSGGSSSGNDYQPMKDHYRNDFANQVFKLINQKRAANGLPPLSHNGYLQGIANERSVEIVDNFSHDGFQNRFGYTSPYSEIIGEGYTTPADVVYGWMNSPGHRGAILYEKNLSMAASCYVTDDGNYFHWVVLFEYDRNGNK